MYSTRNDPLGRVSPFRHPRINACSQLPVAFRSVPRLSSPLSAKASTRCPFALDCRAVAYRGKPRQHDCSDFLSFWLRMNHVRRHDSYEVRIATYSRCQTTPFTEMTSINEYLISAISERFAWDVSGTKTKSSRLQKNWWSWTGSNRRPPACKAGALPTELQPQTESLVGLGRLELPTSRLSSARSNQLSY